MNVLDHLSDNAAGVVDAASAARTSVVDAASDLDLDKLTAPFVATAELAGPAAAAGARYGRRAVRGAVGLVRRHPVVTVVALGVVAAAAAGVLRSRRDNDAADAHHHLHAAA